MRGRGHMAVIMAAVFLAGCGLVEGLKIEAKEEKNILGYVQGYNSRVKEAERILKGAGFNPGVVDGFIDKNLRKAVKDFQKANNIKETGFIDAKTWAQLDALNIANTAKKQQ